MESQNRADVKALKAQLVALEVKLAEMKAQFAVLETLLEAEPELELDADKLMLALQHVMRIAGRPVVPLHQAKPVVSTYRAVSFVVVEAIGRLLGGDAPPCQEVRDAMLPLWRSGPPTAEQFGAIFSAAAAKTEQWSFQEYGGRYWYLTRT